MHADPTIAHAHRLLLALEGTAPPLEHIRVASLPAGIDANCRNGLITVSPDSEFYTAAEHGASLGLASVLLHEHHHAVHGSDEPQAYAASLAFLKKHNASPELVATVERCRDAALASRKHRQTWTDYFAKERELQHLAKRAGLPNPRAAAARLNERLIHRLPPPVAARLLLLALQRASTTKQRNQT